MAKEPRTREFELEDAVTSVQALLADVERIVLRSALKGGIARETCVDAVFKLNQAIKYIQRIPKHDR
jgi:hypothetical protein